MLYLCLCRMEIDLLYVLLSMWLGRRLCSKERKEGGEKDLWFLSTKKGRKVWACLPLRPPPPLLQLFNSQFAGKEKKRGAGGDRQSNEKRRGNIWETKDPLLIWGPTIKQIRENKNTVRSIYMGNWRSPLLIWGPTIKQVRENENIWETEDPFVLI